MDLSKALLQFISEFFLKVAALRRFTKGAMIRSFHRAPSTNAIFNKIAQSTVEICH